MLTGEEHQLVSPPSGLCGVGERVLSCWPIAEAAREFVDGIGERLYLQLKLPQALLVPCQLGIAFRSTRSAHVDRLCPAALAPHVCRRDSAAR